MNGTVFCVFLLIFACASSRATVECSACINVQAAIMSKTLLANQVGKYVTHTYVPFSEYFTVMYDDLCSETTTGEFVCKTAPPMLADSDIFGSPVEMCRRIGFCKEYIYAEVARDDARGFYHKAIIQARVDATVTSMLLGAPRQNPELFAMAFFDLFAKMHSPEDADVLIAMSNTGLKDLYEKNLM